MRKNYRPQRTRMRELGLSAEASFALIIDRNRFYAPAS
jgi:hypothetical protein